MTVATSQYSLVVVAPACMRLVWAEEWEKWVNNYNQWTYMLSLVPMTSYPNIEHQKYVVLSQTHQLWAPWSCVTTVCLVHQQTLHCKITPPGQAGGVVTEQGAHNGSYPVVIPIYRLLQDCATLSWSCFDDLWWYLFYIPKIIEIWPRLAVLHHFESFWLSLFTLHILVAVTL